MGICHMSSDLDNGMQLDMQHQADHEIKATAFVSPRRATVYWSTPGMHDCYAWHNSQLSIHEFKPLCAPLAGLHLHELAK